MQKTWCHGRTLSLLLCASHLSAFANAETTCVNQSKTSSRFESGFKRERPAGKNHPVILDETNCGSGPPPDTYIDLIQTYFEPPSLSRGAKLQFSPIEVAPFYKLESESHSSKADRFYCYQAIWEAIPFAKEVTHQHGSACKFSSDETRYRSDSLDCTNLYLKNHPSLVDKVAVLHFVPCCTAQLYPDAIEEGELHRLNNLISIRTEKLDSKELNNFRRDWSAFFMSNPAASRAQLLKHADFMLDKYNFLFEH